ncbi:hypothetical protein [Endozoicomonas sp. Mp262]|uniref:Lar family restriction alleviation protein n=1 Tax=Endozoicomonas sp. Mp262 TaxID=2919499 RepID=UPI0021D8F1FF
MKLESCPCCGGKAYFADITANELRMWQVTCEQCGLSTEYDEDRAYCRDRWNLRQEKARLKTWLTALAALVPFFAVASFFAGGLAGMTFWK